MDDSAPKRKFLDQLRDLLRTKHYDLYPCFKKGGVAKFVEVLVQQRSLWSPVTKPNINRFHTSTPAAPRILGVLIQCLYALSVNLAFRLRKLFLPLGDRPT